MAISVKSLTWTDEEDYSHTKELGVEYSITHDEPENWIAMVYEEDADGACKGCKTLESAKEFCQNYHARKVMQWIQRW